MITDVYYSCPEGQVAFCFSASSALWNAEPIPPGSAKSKITVHFSATSASVVTYSSFGAFQGWLLTAKDDMVSISIEQTLEHYKKMSQLKNSD